MKKLIIAAASILVLGLSLNLATKSPQSLPQLKETSSVRDTEAYQEPEQAYNDKAVRLLDLDISKGTVILLTSEVTPDTVNPAIEKIKVSNKESPGKPIYILLDSPGGSVIDGARLISAMQASKAPVNTVCLQLCASMAAMILEYGTNRYAVDRSIVMFHPASIESMVMGEVDKIVSRFQFLQRYVNKMDRHVAARAGVTYEQFKAKSSRELWIDAEDALQDKLIDRVVNINLTSQDMSNFGSNSLRENIELVW